MITENLHDQEFLDTYCVGFDKAHMPEGYEDRGQLQGLHPGHRGGQDRQDAGMGRGHHRHPAPKIVQLAREIAQAKPCFMTQGWGPQRQANGEQTSRAIPMLAILTGNIGIHGGGTGARESGYSIGMSGFPTLTNPVQTSISVFNWPDAITRGPEMTALDRRREGQGQAGRADQVHLELCRQHADQPARRHQRHARDPEDESRWSR